MLLKILIIAFLSMLQIPTSQRAEQAINNNQVALKQAFNQQQLLWGSPVYIRIFKASSELEVWVQSGSKFKLFKTYSICNFSGNPGPKLATGDWQSPEGFYFVKPAQLNPWSQYHLSFNLGYPNKYDRTHGRTGSALMVHGSCVSVGCYAMTDPQIEEIYTLMVAAFEGNQAFIRVHAFPFRMSEENLQAQKDHHWIEFWQNLKTGYDFFATHDRPPNVEVLDSLYVFD
ncbi:probable exported protein STY0357 [hydrothermal vent metagenome]|uniref:Probable exported protein STY0357 n=1 Tax=hydrothermal vent metagenome TaxID=652676 RepID=A0A3B0W0Y1_9ZZZZ